MKQNFGQYQYLPNLCVLSARKLAEALLDVIRRY